jgi:hypothetical protein
MITVGARRLDNIIFLIGFFCAIYRIPRFLTGNIPLDAKAFSFFLGGKGNDSAQK